MLTKAKLYLVAWLCCRSTDEPVIIVAILLILFLSGLVFYMTSAASANVAMCTVAARGERMKDAVAEGTQSRHLMKTYAAPMLSGVRRQSPLPPVLVCGMVSPGRLPNGATDRTWASWERLPPPGTCDYIILDIEANPDGSYNESQFHFLLGHNTTARLLFTLASSRPFRELRETFRKLSFQNSAAILNQMAGVRGFGLLDSDHGTKGRALTDKAIRSTVQLFSDLTMGLIAAGYEDASIVTFLALRPVGLRKHSSEFSRLVRVLDGAVRLLILLSISAPRPTCVVEAPAAWDHTAGCFATDDAQPTLHDCLQLITSMEHPKSRLALALSLRIDVFVDVDSSHPALEDMNVAVGGKSCYNRTHHFVQRGVCSAAEQAEDASPPGGSHRGCNFATAVSNSKWRVVSFETPASIEDKMLQTYRTLGPSKGRFLSWLIYNVTSYVAAGTCPDGQTRIDKVRTIMQRFRHPSR
ncbi:uncharacterized protein LOC144151677 [Haemaphysalis longicornis]